jgi:hypothetical protein
MRDKMEVLPKRLYFGSFRFLPPESSSLHLFCIDDTLVYELFYAVRITFHTSFVPAWS